MNKKLIITALLAALLGLVSCEREDIEDKVEQVTVYVSAETGMFYNVPNTTPEEGMMIRIDGEDHYWKHKVRTHPRCLTEKNRIK